MFQKLLMKLIQGVTIEKGVEAAVSLCKGYNKYRDAGYDVWDSVKGSGNELKDEYIGKIIGEEPQKMVPLFKFKKK